MRISRQLAVKSHSADVLYSPAPPTSASSNTPNDVTLVASSIHQLPVHEPSVQGPPSAAQAFPHSYTTIPERVWNEAYDGLKKDDPKLIEAYENILTANLGKDDFSAEGSPVDQNSIEQADKIKRRSQMEQIIDASTKRTEKERKVKGHIGDAMQGLLAVKDMIDFAARTVPQAAVAWTGVALAMQILVNPSEEMKANHDGVIYVSSRMQWYCELSKLTLKENADKECASTDVRNGLERGVIELYRSLLRDLIRSVGYCYRSRGVATLRDLLKLERKPGRRQGEGECHSARRECFRHLCDKNQP